MIPARYDGSTEAFLLAKARAKNRKRNRIARHTRAAQRKARK